MKKKVGILGASGVIGQNYLSFLKNHPWFEVFQLAGSDKSIGKIVEGHRLCEPHGLLRCDLIFSALPSSLAAEYELFYASQGIPVISSAAVHRNEEDVPVVIPEVNAAHLEVIKCQKKNRGWTKGLLITKPNCAIQSFMIPLAPLHRRFGLKQISVTTLQAISGAGSKGIAPQDILDNVIPYIEDEEEKIEKEPLKILGRFKQERIVPESSISISAQCTRVCVLHGHLACVSVSFEQKASKEDILKIWKEDLSLSLPSAPKKPIVYEEAFDRPQPRIDRDRERGMSVTVGRLRPCSVLDWRFVALSHNAIRGGAGGGVLNAELLLQEGYLD